MPIGLLSPLKGRYFIPRYAVKNDNLDECRAVKDTTVRHHPVKSSRIASIGYEESTRTLEVRFHNKNVYQYRGVPSRIFSVFLTVVSKGRFYDGVVKGKYPEHRIA
jgi:hypothetical protein